MCVSVGLSYSIGPLSSWRRPYLRRWVHSYCYLSAGKSFCMAIITGGAGVRRWADSISGLKEYQSGLEV